MLIYIFLFTIISFFIFLDISNMKENTKMYIAIFLGIFLVLLSSIRWNTGTDWISYYYFFIHNNSLDEFLSGDFEIGYAVLNYSIKNIIAQYNILLGIMALSIICLKYRCIFLYSIFPLMSLALNFANSNGDLFPVRQTIAIAMILYSVHFIIQRKKILFIANIVLASTFHISALVFLPAYFIFYLNIRRRYLVIGAFVSIVIGSTSIIENLLEYFVTQFAGNDFYVLFKISDYLDAQKSGENFGAAVSESTANALGILRRCMFLPILIYFKNKFSNINQNYVGFLNLTCIGIFLFYLLYSVSATVAARLSIYYSLFEIFTIPYLFLLVQNNFSRTILWIICIIYCGLKYYYGLYAYYDEFIPFKSIFGVFI